MCIMSVPGALGPEERVRASGTAVMAGYEPPLGCKELNPELKL